MAKHSITSPASKTKPASRLVTIALQCTLAGLSLVTLCMLYFALLVIPSNNAERIDHYTSTLVNHQVLLLKHAFEQLEARALSITQLPNLSTALADKDLYQIERLQKMAQYILPEAASINIIALDAMGVAALDKDKAQLRNNIELDMVGKLSNGEVVKPEAYLFNQQWLISFGLPIQGATQKEIAGALLITLNNQYVTDVLSQIDSTQGQTTLTQTFVSPQVLAQTGIPGRIDLSMTKETITKHWTLTFSPSEQQINRLCERIDTLLIIWAIMLLSTIVTAYVAVSRAKKLLADTLDQWTEPSNDRFTVPDFSEIAEQISSSKNTSSPQEKTTAYATSPSLSKEDLIKTQLPTSKQAATNNLPANIFRAYDIRGIADTELGDNTCFAIGMAIGSEAIEQNQEHIIVAADGRHSSPRIKDALLKGLQSTGCHVIDIGTVPTPLMYFATHQLDSQSGIMITGSHNPAEYNGIKIVINGKALSGDAISALRDRIHSGKLHSGAGQYQRQEIINHYIDYIIGDVAIAQPIKVVIDAGNGVAGAVAPQLFEELGCNIVPLFCDIDGNFPNHHPDPSVATNLEDLIAKVKEEEADIGIAFDGDGDRVGVVTPSGKIVAADKLLMLLAQDVVSRNPGADVLFDVKCTRHLNSLISSYGGRPIMWKTGHSFMKEKMAETGALIGGEFSGHIFFKERWFGFDDGMYAAARLIEILSTSDSGLETQLIALPDSVSTNELKVDSDDQHKFTIIQQLADKGHFNDGKVSTLDGVRVDFPDGWGLVRASNTTPTLVLRFEADNKDALTRIQELFKNQLISIDKTLNFSF